MTMASKPYRKPSQEPLSWKDTPETLLQRAAALCAHYNQSIKDLTAKVSSETATFDNFLLPIAHMNNEWLSKDDFIAFYAEVSPNEEIRDASRGAAQILIAGAINEADLISDPVKAIYDKAEELDSESQRFLDIMRNFCIGSEESASKDRLNTVDKRIGELCIDFDANLRNENGGFWASQSELEGVPNRILDELEPGTGDNEGKFRVVYKWTIGLSVMEYAIDPQLRKKLYLGRSNSVSLQNATLTPYFILPHYLPLPAYLT
jgi:metallopeptidase MepB